jgi:TRAP-type transport system large permease protein
LDQSISDKPLVCLLIVNLILRLLGAFSESCHHDNGRARSRAVAAQFGIGPLHFGLMSVLNSAIGMLTPPVDAILFAVCGVSKTSIEGVTKELWPFLVGRSARSC